MFSVFFIDTDKIEDQIVLVSKSYVLIFSI